MKVTPTGDALCYRVQSESNQQDYFVDLSCYGGNGKCECMNFRCSAHKEPMLAKKRDCWPDNFKETFDEKTMDSTTCKHIRAANRFLANEVKRAIINAREKKQFVESRAVEGIQPESCSVEEGKSDVRGMPSVEEATEWDEGQSSSEWQDWSLAIGGKVLASSLPPVSPTYRDAHAVGEGE